MRPRFAHQQLDPTRVIVLSFAAVIAAGTLLLSLPYAAEPGHRITLVDAFFTATSATCVTGLTVFDIATELSFFGELVVLACIQIGGLGLMTFTTVFLVATGRRLAIADRTTLLASFHHSPVDSLAPLVRYIVLSTLVIEAAGAAVLGVHWSGDPRFASTGQVWYWAVFHAISAFCNAGFSLSAESLLPFQTDALVVLTLSGLILVGGLGFLVGLDLVQFARSATRARQPDAPRPRARLSVHTRLVLTVTGLLLAIATPSYYALEREGVLAGMSAPLAWLNAWFCAVTPRTAGFNTVVFAELGGSALLLTMVLMLIGGSPGSTAGGVKTTTFGLLVANAIARWRGRTRLHMFDRTIPEESVDKANAVVISAIALLVVTCLSLIVMETGGPRGPEEDRRIVALVFEVISAFGTVGLSLGETSGLSDPGRILLALVMFMGRVGPLTLALAIAKRRQRTQFRYAEENVMIG